MGTERLTAEFGIAGVLEFVETPEGMIKASISRDGTVGELYLQGAHVTQFGLADQRPLLFVSPNSSYLPQKAIRGGIPIIFPWFGSIPDAASAPQHGFARVAPWHLDSVEVDGGDGGGLTFTFSLTDQDVGSTFWPERFRAIYKVTFSNNLRLRLAVQNPSPHPIVFEEALHTYFAVSDISRVTVSGLHGTIYIDKTEGAKRKPQTDQMVTVVAETDRVYLNTPRQCAIEDSDWGRRILVEKDGAASTVVWNPWAIKGSAMADLGDAWRNMICVESGNIADDAVRLAPDEEHEMSTTISLQSGP